MMNETSDFFSKKQNRLLDIAKTAELFAWLILFIQILLIGARVIEAQTTFLISNIDFYQRPDFWSLLTKYPIYRAGFFVDLTSILVRGIGFWLGLKGISLGLKMIVETDLNYRDKVQRGEHER